MDDLERFNAFGKKGYNNDTPKIFNIWRFPARDKRLGIKYPGNISGQISMNLLYYYTNIGDMIIDPMAGGGSTVDACLVMGRKCFAYDIDPQCDEK